VWNNSHTKELVAKSMTASLSDLQVSYIDLVLIHWPCNFKYDEKEGFPKDAAGKIILAGPEASVKNAWQGLEAAVDAKQVRSIGISNFTPAETDELLTYARIKPATNQVELHPSGEALSQLSGRPVFTLVAIAPHVTHTLLCVCAPPATCTRTSCWRTTRSTAS